jgi:hypothetical protein
MTHPFIGSRCIASAGAHEEALEAAPRLIIDTYRSLATRWRSATADDRVFIEQRMIAEAVDYGTERSAEGFSARPTHAIYGLIHSGLSARRRITQKTVCFPAARALSGEPRTFSQASAMCQRGLVWCGSTAIWRDARHA